jgi:hypothetical protein
MAGAGFILDMNSRIKENRALLHREKYHDKIQEYIFVKYGLEMDIKNLSDEEFLKMHVKVMMERKKDLYKRIGILFFSIMITVFMVFGLLHFL